MNNIFLKYKDNKTGLFVWGMVFSIIGVVSCINACVSENVFFLIVGIIFIFVLDTICVALQKKAAYGVYEIESEKFSFFARISLGQMHGKGPFSAEINGEAITFYPVNQGMIVVLRTNYKNMDIELRGVMDDMSMIINNTTVVDRNVISYSALEKVLQEQK